MPELYNSFSEFEVLNSITNSKNDEKLDFNKPFSFIEFLNFTKTLDDELNNLKQYEIYIKKWNKIVEAKNSDFKTDIKDQYLNFFREISLKFTNAEEKRYLESIDFNNEENLTIAIPFYSRKIKEICLYFKDKRNTFSREFRELKNKGSVNSIEQYTKSKIIDLFEGDDIPPQASSILALSALQNNLEIEIEESYDVFNDYYDLDPNKLPEFYNTTLQRNDYFTSNVNDINPYVFLDFDQAIINFINEKGIKLTELGDFSPTITFDTTDLSLLDGTDFINYINNGDRDNLKLILEAELAKNLIGTDYYFLSTNSNNEFLSGNLFESNNKVNNILNINYPSTLTIPSSSNEYERNVGLYFKPTNFSLIAMKGGYNITLKEELSADTLYIVPDPNSYGNISSLSKSPRKTPFDFVLKNDIYRNVSSSLGQKNIKSDFTDQNFYSYNSFEQYRNNSNLLSTFSEPYASFVNKGIIENVNYDIFGNRFVEYINDTSYVQNLCTNDIVNDKTVFTNSNTLSNFFRKGSKKDFLDKKLEIKDVFVQNISTNEYDHLNVAFNRVFEKYKKGDSLLYNDLLSGVKNINIYENIFSIDTTNFSLIDNFEYDGSFKPSTNTPLIIPVTLTDDNFTGVSNDYVVDNKIFKVVINLIPEFSATNDKFFYEFFSYNKNTFKEQPIRTRANTPQVYFESTFSLPLSSVPKRIRNTNLTFSSKINAFNLFVQYNDSNENVYLHNFTYKIFNNDISIISNALYAPNNYYNTNNFFTTDLSSYFITTSLSGEIEQNYEKGEILI